MESQLQQTPPSAVDATKSIAPCATSCARQSLTFLLHGSPFSRADAAGRIQAFTPAARRVRHTAFGMYVGRTDVVSEALCICRRVDERLVSAGGSH